MSSGRPGIIRVSLADRFWKRVDKSGGCWVWLGKQQKRVATAGKGGYGLLHMPLTNKYRFVHRVSWELHNGPIPEGMQVCHTCDNRLCVRPDHLFLGTQADNLADASRKGRMAKILNIEKAHSIKEALKAGESQHSIARRFGIYRSLVWSIHRGHSWRHA